MRQGVNSSDQRNLIRVRCVFRLLVGSLALLLASPYADASLVISEFMASNGSSLVDEDGDNSDWLEIHNLGDSAVSLEGMYLTDDPENLTRWAFPAVALEPDGFLVVFASGKDRAAPGGELHTNFSLGAEGEYLALVGSDGGTVLDAYEPTFPEQLTDVSYGRTHSIQTMVGGDSEVEYHVPDSGDAAIGEAWVEPAYSTSGWKSGRYGIGFTSLPPSGFEATCIRANTSVGNLSTAEEVVESPWMQLSTVTESADVINYFNSGGQGNFSSDNMFPGMTTEDIDDFVLLATATISIPSAGDWSFGVNSDDGFGLVLDNGVDQFSMAYPNPRGNSDTISVFKITQPGAYQLRLLFFERGGGASVELFAAQGNHPSFNYDDFRLVGDVAGGGLGFSGVAEGIETDVSEDMVGENASIWMRSRFAVEDPDAVGELLLNIRYEDGVVAYLNGERVLERNAPATISWNAHAHADRPLDQIGVLEQIDLTGFLPLLEVGENVWAMHGLNESDSDPDFLLDPELIGIGREQKFQYMQVSTPGAMNAEGSDDFVKDVEFSVPHGFYDSGFSLALSTPSAGTRIYVTLDGSTPSQDNGFLYIGTISINKTTCVRAIAQKDGWIDSRVGTQSYFFVEDIIRQSPFGQAPTSDWPTGRVNDQVFDYGMDPEIVNSGTWGGQIRGALVDIPTISLVTDLDNLFDPAKGIYVNARNDGRAWERPTSVELIRPDGLPGFAVDAGLRIRGAFSRTPDNPKHSLRLFFRNEYGPGKLRYPLFDTEGVDEFDKVDLRTSQNYSWAYEGSEQNTMLRDVFSRDVQRDMGQPYTRSRYYHLYLNGHYWGVYQTEERGDADYAESYLGGRAGDFDVIKNDSSAGRALHASDGTMDAYRRLYDAATNGFSSDAAYLSLLGLKPDGTPDPNGEVLLDAQNLMDYMICTYYTGDPDSPISCWGHFSNNVFAVFNREHPNGFSWYRHDAEHSLGANGGLNESRLLTDPTDRSIGQEWRHFNPAWLHVRLTKNLEYRIQFADRVARHFFNGGLLTPERNIERWLGRADELQLAIIAESARWGDAKRTTPRTKSHWLTQVNNMVQQYFPFRTQRVIDQMRLVEMFPDHAVVFLDQPGGVVEPGFTLGLTQQNGDIGVIYYTLDGTDPRLWGGGIAPGAMVYDEEGDGIAITESTTVRARVYGANSWGALTEARYTVSLGGVVINEFMARNVGHMEDPDEPGEYPDWIELVNSSAERVDLGGMFLTDDPDDLTLWRIPFGTVLEPGAHLLIYADDDPSQGLYHAKFRLDQAGESILLVATDGSTVVDSIQFGPQFADISYGRYPDGSAVWGFHETPTPAGTNTEHMVSGVRTVPLLGVRVVDVSSVVFEWESCVGCLYQIQWTDDFTAETWTTLGTLTATTDRSQAEVPVPAESIRGFFRVVEYPNGG